MLTTSSQMFSAYQWQIIVLGIFFIITIILYMRVLQSSLLTKYNSWLVGLVGAAVCLLYFFLGAPLLVADTTAVQHIQQRIEHILAKPNFKSEDLKFGLAQIQVEISGNAFGLSRLSELYTQMGQISEAKNCLMSAINLEPKNADYKAELVNLIFMENGDKLGYAKPMLDEVLELNPNHPGALNLLAIDLYQNNREDEALDIWEKLIKEAPKGSDIEQTLRATIKQLKRNKHS